jgi:hypothetical protein
MKIHDIFHTFLIRKIATNSLTRQTQSSSFFVVIDNEEEYETNDILNNRYHYDKLQYKVVWIDHFSDRAWYSAENFEHFKNILKNYHQRYSEKLESELRLIVIIETMLLHWIKNEHEDAKRLVQKILNKMNAEMKESDQNRISKDSFETNDLARKESWISAY